MKRAMTGSGAGAAKAGGPYAGSVRNVHAWLRRHPWRADGLLAVVVFAFSAGQIPAGPASVRLTVVAVSALLAATVVPRRRYPVAAFTAAAAIGAAQIVAGLAPGGATPRVQALQPNLTDLAIVVLLYTLAAHRPRPISVAGLAVCLLGSAVAIARWAPAHAAYPGGQLFAAAAGLGGAALTAWVLGDSVAYRYRRAYYASLEERAARLEAERDAQARLAAAAERARELQERRARVIDESAARLRRIERDLHDGAQVRLAALAMSLGEIREDIAAGGTDPERTAALVAAAHDNAKITLAELRDLARGIHPPVLDRGLGAALSTLAGTSPVPVEVSAGAGDRPSPAIETIAYFCAAELLANVAKHSGAGQAAISVSEQDGRIIMTVTDNGGGGARLVPGGGLAGLVQRVQTVDGRLDVDSPPGGPTTVTIELPGHA
jgi:signal transduction histidine kinase